MDQHGPVVNRYTKALFAHADHRRSHTSAWLLDARLYSLPYIIMLHMFFSHEGGKKELKWNQKRLNWPTALTSLFLEENTPFKLSWSHFAGQSLCDQTWTIRPIKSFRKSAKHREPEFRAGPFCVDLYCLVFNDNRTCSWQYRCWYLLVLLSL